MKTRKITEIEWSNLKGSILIFGSCLLIVGIIAFISLTDGYWECSEEKIDHYKYVEDNQGIITDTRPIEGFECLDPIKGEPNNWQAGYFGDRGNGYQPQINHKYCTVARYSVKKCIKYIKVKR